MSTDFQCPSCKRTLQFDGGDSVFQTCRYCKGKIIVPSVAINKQEVDQRKPISANQQNSKLAEIHRELAEGRKINAIKLFREIYGTDLKTAKDTIDSMELRSRVPTDTPAQDRSYANANPDSQIVNKMPAGNSSAAGRIVSFIIQIAAFAAFLYWFFG